MGTGGLDGIWRGHDINDTRTLMSNYGELLLRLLLPNAQRIDPKGDSIQVSLGTHEAFRY